MNIAIFASQFYPHVGGVEEVVRQLAHEQLQRGDRPIIITNRWPKSLSAVEEYEDLIVHRYAFRFPGPNLRQMIGVLLYRQRTLSKIYSDLITNKSNLIHIQCVGPNAYYALMAKRRLKLPLVVTLHAELTMDATGFYARSNFGKRLLYEVLKEADAIAACSQNTLKEAERFFGINFGDRGRVIYNGIRIDEYLGVEPYKRTRPYILGIGRFVIQKGFDVLLRAFARTIHAGNETHDLLLVGDGPERNNLKRLSQKLGISNRVDFFGETKQ